ncbi:MAG: PEP-CTERM sorting domain-containing protein [Chthoniobacter sp.]
MMPPLVHFRLLLRVLGRRSAVWALLAGGIGVAFSVRGQTVIPVDNFSFENPTTTFVTTVMPSWQKVSQAADFDPNQGFTWDQESGIFVNTPPSSTTDHVTNLDGNQSAYLFSDQGVGIYQTLSATYQLGQSYHLTVGIIGQGGGMPDGATIQIQLYYLTPDNTMVTLASTTATENATNFPDHTTMFDYSADVSTVGLFDVWLGRPIGIEIISPETGAAFLGGYWDVDDVRLTSAPEPASAALLAIGGLALLGRRPRRCRA